MATASPSELSIGGNGLESSDHTLCCVKTRLLTSLPVTRQSWPPAGTNSTYRTVQFCQVTFIQNAYSTVGCEVTEALAIHASCFDISNACIGNSLRNNRSN